MEDGIMDVGDINGNTVSLDVADKVVESLETSNLSSDLPVTKILGSIFDIPVSSEKPKILEKAAITEENDILDAVEDPQPVVDVNTRTDEADKDSEKVEDKGEQIEKLMGKQGRHIPQRRLRRFTRRSVRKVILKKDVDKLDIANSEQGDVDVVEKVESIKNTESAHYDVVTVPATNQSTITDDMLDITDSGEVEQMEDGGENQRIKVGSALAKAKPAQAKNHYQILQRCSDRALLHSVLKVGPSQYQCPICNCYKNHVGYMLLHIRVHKNLDPVFELYKKAGGTMEEIVNNEVPDPSDEIAIQPVPKIRLKGFVSPAVELVGKRLRRRSTKHDLGIFYDNSLVRKIIRKRRKTNDLLENKDATKENSDGPSDTSSNSTPLKKKSNLSKTMIKGVHGLESDTNSLANSDDIPDSRFDNKPDISLLADSKEMDNKIEMEKLKKPAKVRRKIQNRIKKEQAVPVRMKKPYHMSRKMAALLKHDLAGKVSTENPHTCKFCGKVFYQANGIHFHYAKHAKSLAIPTAKKSFNRKQNGESGKPFDRAEYAFDELVSALKKEEQENEAGLLKVLGNDVNILIEQMVGDTNVLNCLGWPNRNAGELVIDILERCGLQPSRERLNIMSPLQCLRKNIFELLTFCIEESAMQDYGWNIKSVDDVVKEIIRGGV